MSVRFVSLNTVILSLVISHLTHALPAEGWSPYVNLAGGMSAQSMGNVVFDNPRQPQFIQNSNGSATGFGSAAIGTYVPALPVNVELRATFNGQSNFNREYFFPSFFSVVGVQKLRIQSNYLMARGYYNIPFSVFTPYLSLGAGASWNKTTGTQYAPQLPGWIYEFNGTTQSQFAWSVGAGLSQPLNDQFMLNVGYNFVALGTFDTGILPQTGDEHIFGKLNSNEVFIGFTYFV
jgi:opacity protein-like surface antigen